VLVDLAPLSETPALAVLQPTARQSCVNLRNTFAAEMLLEGCSHFCHMVLMAPYHGFGDGGLWRGHQQLACPQSVAAACWVLFCAYL
jgi:hypothetical protein